MHAEAWSEDGYWWRQDWRGNLFWLDGKRWRRFQKPSVLGAAGEAAAETAYMAFLASLIAYSGVRKFKNSIL